jgi:hypothetical protein
VGLSQGIGVSLQALGCVSVAVEVNAEAQEWFQEALAGYTESGQQVELDTVLALMGYSTRGLGDLRKAEERLHEAMWTGSEIGAFLPLITALPAVALLLADAGQTERAVEFYALASRYPYVANSRWFEDVAGKHIAAVTATLPPDVVAAAQERGRVRDLWATAEEFVTELNNKNVKP